MSNACGRRRGRGGLQVTVRGRWVWKKGKCFAAQMEAADIAAVKKALQAEAGEGVAIVNDRITLEGFMPGAH